MSFISVKKYILCFAVLTVFEMAYAPDEEVSAKTTDAPKAQQEEETHFQRLRRTVSERVNQLVDHVKRTRDSIVTSAKKLMTRNPQNQAIDVNLDGSAVAKASSAAGADVGEGDFVMVDAPKDEAPKAPRVDEDQEERNKELRAFREKYQRDAQARDDAATAKDLKVITDTLSKHKIDISVYPKLKDALLQYIKEYKEMIHAHNATLPDDEKLPVNDASMVFHITRIIGRLDMLKKSPNSPLYQNENAFGDFTPLDWEFATDKIDNKQYYAQVAKTR